MMLAPVLRMVVVMLAIVWQLAILFLATFAIYFVLGSPLRRQERARFFLDLLERGLRSGQSAERTIVELHHTRDPELGARFHSLAAHIESGMRFGEALRRVPYLLPPVVVATLRVGEKSGDLLRVLPACRKMLVSASSRVTSAVNFLFIVMPLLGSSALGVWMFILVVIVPKFMEVSRDLGAGEMATAWSFLEHFQTPIVCLSFLVSFGLLILVVCYALGPRLARRFATLADRLAWWLPWRRRRLLRDFSTMLSVLLDGGLPESQAIALAAESTANHLIVRRAEAVAHQLERGVSLPDALLAFDDGGEFRWRLSNAVHCQGGFLRALAGWHEALEARAYQQEQAVSQLGTTGLVVLNGVFVALVAIGMFQMFTSVIERMVLW